MFDLTVALPQIDLAITAEPVLKVDKTFDKLQVTAFSSRPSAISLPSRPVAGLFLVVIKAGNGALQFPNPFQDAVSSCSKISCRSISMSAASSAGSLGERALRSSLSAIAFSDRPRPS